MLSIVGGLSGSHLLAKLFSRPMFLRYQEILVPDVNESVRRLNRSRKNKIFASDKIYLPPVYHVRGALGN